MFGEGHPIFGQKCCNSYRISEKKKGFKTEQSVKVLFMGGVFPVSEELDACSESASDSGMGLE